MAKKKISRLDRVNATLDRFAKLIEDNARQLRKDKAEAKRQRAEDRAKLEHQLAEWERQRAEDRAEAKRRQDEAEAEAKRRQDEAKAEAKRRQDEAKAEAKRRQDEAEADAKWRAEHKESLQEMRASVSNLGKNVRGLGISIGDITEAITVSGKIIDLVNNFAGIEVDSFDANLERTYALDPRRELEGDNKKDYEIDGLVVGKTAVMVIEAKTKLTKRDVFDFIKGLKKFKQVFYEHADRDVYAGVAFIRANDKTLDYAEKSGLFIIKAAPPDVTLVNSQNFKPTKFA